MRNKKSVLFINPGSVGQPRNHNKNAQYAVLDTSVMETALKAIPYNISDAAKLFPNGVDPFYRDRLYQGI